MPNIGSVPSSKEGELGGSGGESDERVVAGGAQQLVCTVLAPFRRFTAPSCGEGGAGGT